MSDPSTPVRARRQSRPSRRLSEATESAKIMKRTFSAAELSSESSGESDDTDVDHDYKPRRGGAKKRRTAVARHSQAVPKNTQRTAKTPKRARKAARAKGAAKNASQTDVPRNVDLESAISADARLPPTDLGAVEFMTFFPLHIRWTELGLRVYRNEWKSLSVAKATLHARNKLQWSNDKAVTRRRQVNRRQVIENGKKFFHDPKFAPTRDVHKMTPLTTYNASNYTPLDDRRIPRLFDAKLIDIASGVVNWPMGEDRGIVTQAILYAVRNNLHDLTTADIPQLAVQHGFQAPADSLGPDWDQNALQRSEARIELTGNYRFGGTFDAAYQDETEDEE